MAIHDDMVDLQAFQISDLARQVERLLDIYEQVCFFAGSSQRSSLHTLGHMGFVHFVRLIEIHGRSSEIIIANVSLCSGVRILDGCLHLYALSGPAKDGH